MHRDVRRSTRFTARFAWAWAGALLLLALCPVPAQADLDSDGLPDLVFALRTGNFFASNDNYAVCLQDDASGFACTGFPSNGYSANDVALGDLNGNTIIDAIFASEGPSLCLNDGNGVLSCSDLGSEGADPTAVALGHVNSDGALDAVFVNVLTDPTVCLNNNDGTPTFACSVGAIPNGTADNDVALGFVDGDTNLDAIFAGGSFNQSCLGDGLGSFVCSDIPEPFFFPSSSAVALGKVDGDDFVDAVFATGFATATDGNLVCLGDGTGFLDCYEIELLEGSNQDVALGDLNGDRNLDAVFAKGDGPFCDGSGDGAQANRVCFGNGLGSFTCQDLAAGNSQGVAIVDSNGDRNPDVVFANLCTRDVICFGDGAGGFACEDILPGALVSQDGRCNDGSPCSSDAECSGFICDTGFCTPGFAFNCTTDADCNVCELSYAESNQVAACAAQGDCCDLQGNGSPGCEDSPCQGAVCDLDPYCCDVAWDDVCALAASELCDVCIPTGACCGADASCAVLTAEECAAADGTYQGDGTSCDQSFVDALQVVDAPVLDAQPGATDTIAVAETGTVLDVDVDLTIDHTWVGDLIVELEHGGVSVVLIDRPGVPAGSFGCGEEDYDQIVLDDEGTGGPIEDLCAPDPTSPPNYVPIQALAAFDGMDVSGDWTITVTDAEEVGSDEGVLVSWSIHVQTDAPLACPFLADLDIKPGSCPNPFNRKSNGVLPVAVVGRPDFDVADIDLSTVVISRADGMGGSVGPHEGPPGPHSTYSDVATPFEGELCDCHGLEGDGITDLSMKFKTAEVVEALGLDALDPGALITLEVSGELLDGTPFLASDCVRLVPPGSGPVACNVSSNESETWVQVSPLDETLDGGGFGQFERTFPGTTVVTLWPEPEINGAPFHGWRVNGGPIQKVTPSTGSSLQLTLDGETKVQAVYKQQGLVCGLGVELALVVPALLLVRRRLRGRA